MRDGPHRTGRSGLYLERLSDVDGPVLREPVGRAFRHLDGQTVTG